jgi:flagellar motor protein MotB
MKPFIQAEVHMLKWLGTLVLVVAIVLGAAYYWLFRPQAEQLEQARWRADQCAVENRQLQTSLADLQTVRDQLKNASAELQAQVTEKQQEMDALRSTHDELVGELKKEIEDKQIEVERVRDKLRVDLVDEILFDSGEAQLKPEGIAVLKKIGGVLAHAERGIEIQGHTDNVPILGALAKRFPTNWELSAARAINVARFLQDEAHVAPERISAAAYSQYQPRASNDTEEGRRKNRRIEIMLVPLEKTEQPAAAKGTEGGQAEAATASPEPQPIAGATEKQGQGPGATPKPEKAKAAGN